VSGKCSFTNPEHPQKALLPIAVSVSGKCTSTKPEHPEKAAMPIAVNLSGMTTFFLSFHLYVNASFGTVSHPRKESAKSNIIGAAIAEAVIQPSWCEEVSVGAEVMVVSGAHPYYGTPSGRCRCYPVLLS
jgi:hypothetical protein